MLCIGLLMGRLRTSVLAWLGRFRCMCAIVITLGLAALGHGRGYLYPHDEKSGVARQQYAPDGLVGRVYYRPTVFGAERELGERLKRVEFLRRPAENG